MSDEKNKVLPEDITDVNMFAAVLNKQFAKYNEILSKTMTKDEAERKQAELIVENKEILKSLKIEGDKTEEMKGQLKDLTDTIKIQGEFITKMKTYAGNMEQKKTVFSEISKGIDTPEFKNFLEGKTTKAKFQIETKDVAFTGTYGSGAVVQPYMPFQVPQGPDMENFDVRLILPTGVIGNSSLQYPTERAASLTDATTYEAENADLNESTMGFTMATAYASRIGAFIEISRSALQNTPWLNSYLSNRLMAMFVKKLNTSSIAGTGSGAGMAGANDLNGLVNQANTFAGTEFASKIAYANYFDVLNCAKGEMNALYYQRANTYLINPYTGTILTSSKNTISDFIAPATFLKPNEAGYSGAFGMRQIETADITAGTYLAANISPSNMQLLFNGPIEVMATDSHASNFIADLVTIKIEGRVLLPIYNANSLMKGTFETDLATIKIV